MSRPFRAAMPLAVLALAAALTAGHLTAQTAAPAVQAPAPPAAKAPAAPAPAARQAATKAAAAPATAPAAPDYVSVLGNLKFREIGPAAMGGRVDDFAVVESNPSIVYAGLASGGVWKTTNGGTTWTPVFDNEEVSTIGDVTVAASDPDVVWVGTGEPNNRQSSSWGNGVYKSTDGGRTWKHMGLRETHHIGRIVIHPRDPDVLYVAAVGRLWGPSKERGLYKTSDGGTTWKHVLAINEDTGVVDVAMDPESPDTLYAAAYQRRRTVFGFAGSGPDGGIYKTTDGGATWKKLVKGLPWDPEPPRPRQAQGGGPPAEVMAMFGITPPEPEAPARATAADPKARVEIGRIGLEVYRSDPSVVYALVEHASGGIFRSEDKGETWEKMSDTNPRPMYYSKVRVDPTNDQRIWVLGANMFYSEDGGKTFDSNMVQRIHGDYHALWINPANSDHMVVGSDGGIHWSWDRGRTWDFVNTIAIGQFYEIGLDNRRPYYICGGLQDNNTWCGPSGTMNPRGIANSDWFTIGGGDGFYAQMDPNDPNIVYAESQDGNVLRRDLRTGESRSIRPQPAEGERAYRFQWNSPIVISAHDPKTIYYGGNFVFKSIDRGDGWTRISPDLTTGADRNTLPIMGRVPDAQTRSRHDGVQNWPAITSLSESPRSADILWAGTDDGNLQVTRDGGKTWKNVFDRVTGVPKGTYVSRVVASRHADGTAYATFDGHRSDDFGIYVYTTTDFGETWKKITTGLPANNGIVNVIREHPKNPDLLFAGTEHGAFVSFTRGASWSPLKLNLPTVPVDDIQIHPRDNDLVFGTHGRSIWILDDITPLAELTSAVLGSDLHAFSTRPAIQYRPWSNTGSTGHKEFFGPNAPNGALIHYYLKAKPGAGEQVKITVTDKAGKTVRSLNGTGEAGINRVVWDTRMDSPVPPAPPGTGGGGGGGGFGGFGAFGAMGPRVEPGDYTVKIAVGGKEATTTVTVQEDPRVMMTDADRAAKQATLARLMPKLGPMVTAQRSIQQMRQSLSTAMEGWKRPNARIPENVQKAGEALLKKIDDLYPNFGTPPSEARGLGDAGPPLVDRPTPYSQRMTQLFAAISNMSAAPTAWQNEQVTLLTAKADELVPQVRALSDELAALNKLMNEAGVPHISVGPGGGRPGGRQP
jgi:photosystem II stability/assembly factor-like uncharacterized protein